MDIITLILFLLGFGLLIIGAEFLVRGASNLALAMGIAPLVIGLTIVAFGTSAPEIAINLQAALNQQPDLAIGNVVGSNILNILLILGIAALIAPIGVSQRLIRWDVPIMIGASGLLLLFALDNKISSWEGLVFISIMALYTTFSIMQGRARPVQLPSEELTEPQTPLPTTPELSTNQTYRLPLQILFIIAGLGLLIQGAHWLVIGGVVIAEYFGISQLIIGLTILAIGTSLPEIATVVVASLRGQQELIVGNVIGSNLFNILLVLGLSSIIAPLEISSAALTFDIPIMIATALLCLPIFFTNNLIERWEGGLFVSYYLAYTLYLIFKATEHDYLSAFNTTMLGIIIPLTLLTLIVSVWQTLKKR